MPAVSKKQQRFFGIVRRGMKAGKVPKSYSTKAAKAAKTMSLKAVRHFAKTEQSGLPEKKNNPGPSNGTFPSIQDAVRAIRNRKKRQQDIMKELFG
jgi:hypothetical protein